MAIVTITLFYCSVFAWWLISTFCEGALILKRANHVLGAFRTWQCFVQNACACVCTAAIPKAVCPLLPLPLRADFWAEDCQTSWNWPLFTQTSMGFKATASPWLAAPRFSPCVSSVVCVQVHRPELHHGCARVNYADDTFSETLGVAVAVVGELVPCVCPWFRSSMKMVAHRCSISVYRHDWDLVLWLRNDCHGVPCNTPGL